VLTQNDAAKAFTAILDFVATPKESLAWINEHVKPATVVDPRRVAKLIEDLNDNQYRVRQNATAELLQIGDLVVPAIDKALSARPTLETLRRLQDTRKRLVSPVLKGEQLRMSRAVEVLERIGTTQARHQLEKLAGGAPGAMLTKQARAAFARLPSDGVP
jgi:HEAT repeat protein